jgi:hypothetical protein
VIATDYASSPALDAESDVPELAAPQGETISLALEYLESAYGGVAAYLAGGGAKAEHFTLLAARLLG